MNQLYINIYPHISSLLHLSPTLPIPPLEVDTKHGADLPVLCGCFPLAILHLVVYIYIHATLSLRPSLPFPLPVSSVHSLHLCLYSCPASRFFRTFIYLFIFRFLIHVLAYGICFSLSDLLYSVCQTLGPSTSLQITQFRFFLWLSNMLLYICATLSLSIHLMMDT